MLVKFIFNFIHVCQAQCQKTSEQDTVDPNAAGRAAFTYIYSIKKHKHKVWQQANKYDMGKRQERKKKESKTYRQNNTGNTRQRQEDIVN